jgi:hypothetical protein
MNAHSIEIERIILTDLGVTPDRAERIRVLVEIELQRLLTRGEGLDGLTGGEIHHLAAPPMHVANAHDDDRHIANGVAQSVAQAIRGTKGK